ncbi:hypothetical protein HHK36_013433 [Tetracentron sinense]|uniref:Uncharacterized protein n=1 Tax=Tetracentron sinense TaxID=13715 RepID=A0A834Z698_TETSI|nr:hypothetical protein HHK36_013433 [Tetracentron sinense]
MNHGSTCNFLLLSNLTPASNCTAFLFLLGHKRSREKAAATLPFPGCRRRFPLAPLYLEATWSQQTIVIAVTGEGNCKDAQNKNTSICGENNDCYDSKRHSGYLCECFLWHEGNPYLNGPRECQAIDYCDDNDFVPEATCHNIHGGHSCKCPKWREGTVLSIPFMITALFWFYCAKKNRHLAKMRAKYFCRNGGLLLQQHFSSGKGTTTKHIKIFYARELETATNNYDISRVLGWGSQGTVYKGILDGASTIAIKRPVQHEETQDYSSLVMHFQSYVGKENLFKILDEEIVKEGKFEEMRVVAGIVSRCLAVFGYERPTMKKVAQKLASMRRDTP